MDTVSRIGTKPRRTKPRGRHPDKALSAAFIRSAPPGRHADGNGLFLYVKSEGTRSWIQRLVIRGRRRELGLGAVSLVSLAEARDVALANRKLARSGGDPLADKRRAAGVPTFAEAARSVVEQKQSGWRGKYHAHNWLRSLERYAFPRIGKRPVSEVNSADVLEILAPIWHSKAETARAVRQRLRTVLEWAVAMEWRSDNPCDRVGPVLGPQGDIVRHMRALPHGEVAAAVETVRTSASAAPAIRLAFEFLVLTAGRSAEVRLATWDEMDVASAVWTIAAERMKAKREHRVPLSDRAVEVLEAARALADSELVFPMRSGRSIAWSRAVSEPMLVVLRSCARRRLVAAGAVAPLNAACEVIRTARGAGDRFASGPVRVCVRVACRLRRAEPLRFPIPSGGLRRFGRRREVLRGCGAHRRKPHGGGDRCRSRRARGRFRRGLLRFGGLRRCGCGIR